MMDLEENNKMTPFENELRWERIWNLVLLDAIAIYREDLSLGIDHKNIRDLLRPTLDRHYLQYEYGVAAGRLSSLLISALREDASDDELYQFYLWGDRIFSLGSDRTAEFFWLSVVQNREEIRNPAWIESAFGDIRNVMEVPQQELTRKINTLSAQLSESDRKILLRIDMSEETLATCLSLTGRYNIFACAWRNVAGAFSGVQLDEINTLGKEWAAKRDVQETAVSYPGSWDFGLPLHCHKMKLP